MAQQQIGAVDLDLYSSSFDKTVALGEPQTAADWVMEIEGFPEASYLMQNFQLPELSREEIEDYGPHGVHVRWYGRPMNSVEIPFTMKEVRAGTAYNILKDIVKNKKYVNITVTMLGTSGEGNSFLYENCMFQTVEGLDLAYEDSAQVLKPSGTIICNSPPWWNGSE